MLRLVTVALAEAQLNRGESRFILELLHGDGVLALSGNRRGWAHDLKEKTRAVGLRAAAESRAT